MNQQVITLLIALFTGAGIALQGSLNGRLGASVAPLTNGLLVMMGGGTIALLIFLAIHGRNMEQAIQLTPAQWSYVLISGALGVVAIGGTTFIFPRLGIVAGALSILLGQMVISFIFDTFGFLGTPTPITFERILGLAFVAAGVWLASPRT